MSDSAADRAQPKPARPVRRRLGRLVLLALGPIALLVAAALGQMSEIVRVDADAVAADQARAKGLKVPLGAGRFQHFERLQAQLLE